MFDEGDGHVASASDLLVGVVASPENTGVESKSDDGSDVGCVESALCRMLSVMSANVGVVKWIASGFGVDCEGMRRLLGLPLLDQGVYGIDQAVLRN